MPGVRNHGYRPCSYQYDSVLAKDGGWHENTNMAHMNSGRPGNSSKGRESRTEPYKMPSSSAKRERTSQYSYTASFQWQSAEMVLTTSTTRYHNHQSSILMSTSIAISIAISITISVATIIAVSSAILPHLCLQCCCPLYCLLVLASCLVLLQ